MLITGIGMVVVGLGAFFSGRRTDPAGDIFDGVSRLGPPPPEGKTPDKFIVGLVKKIISYAHTRPGIVITLASALYRVVCWPPDPMKLIRERRFCIAVRVNTLSERGYGSKSYVRASRNGWCMDL